MKTFKQHVKESFTAICDAQEVKTVQNSIEDVPMSAHNIHDPEVLKQVNALCFNRIKNINHKKFSNELKEKL